MAYESVIQELAAAQSSEQKAAIVAEAVIQDLPPELARVAIGCSFLPWFSVDLIKGLLGPENNTIQKIIDLPFIETIPLGYCFHSSTRRGLLQKYKSENPSEIVSMFDAVQKQLDAISDTAFQSLIMSLYGYVITNRGLNAEKLLWRLLEEGKIRKVEEISLLDEAEEFCIADGIGLTPNYWFYRGNLFLIAQDFEYVIKYCDKALSLDKNYYTAYSIRSLAQTKLGNFEDAFRDINMAIQVQPDEMLYRSRALLFMLKGDYKNSIFDFTRALRHNPKDFQAYIGRAQVYLSNKKEDKAFHDLDAALVLSEDSKAKFLVYLFYANALMERGEFARALVFFDKTLQIEATSGAYRRKGTILLKYGKLEEAKECYEQSLKLDENPYSYLGRGKLNLHAGNYEKAISDFKKALFIRIPMKPLPLNPLDIKEGNLRLWEAYLRLGDIDSAEEQKNILIDTTEKAELSEILFFCRKYSLFEAMLEVSKKLIENDKESSFGYIAAGYALNQLEDYQGALEFFEMEEEIYMSNATDKINAGISYWGLQHYEKAKDYFEQANKELKKKPERGNFSSGQKSRITDFSERVWLKVMFGNSKSALHSIDEYLQSIDIDIDEFYNLRDWGAVIKRSSDYLPEGFGKFYDRISKVLLDLDSKSIYDLHNGI